MGAVGANNDRRVRKEEGEKESTSTLSVDSRPLQLFSRGCAYAYVVQEGLAVASIARDDPSTLSGDDPFPRARMHRDRNAR